VVNVSYSDPATTDEERAARARWNDLRRKAVSVCVDKHSNHLRKRKRPSTMNRTLQITTTGTAEEGGRCCPNKLAAGMRMLASTNIT
jgi:hypothetical protein